ncbi:PREDICTED: EF-hand calcium-binding domain-containing protein 10-like, partial [Apaloderma vittatum]|uniref:EF-hand calcium-binding domain-containing protein 10-like n=1 Tax=Apaloderma vittatum TaxID=57397 RepID=UPI0005217B9B
NPREFLIQALERVKAGKRSEGEYPYLMDEGNLAAMFGLLDVVGRGHITAGEDNVSAVQRRCVSPARRLTLEWLHLHRITLKTLGLSTEDLQLGDDVNITLDIFKEEVLKRVSYCLTLRGLLYLSQLVIFLHQSVPGSSQSRPHITYLSGQTEGSNTDLDM